MQGIGVSPGAKKREANDFEIKLCAAYSDFEALTVFVRESRSKLSPPCAELNDSELQWLRLIFNALKV